MKRSGGDAVVFSGSDSSSAARGEGWRKSLVEVSSRLAMREREVGEDVGGQLAGEGGEGGKRG